MFEPKILRLAVRNLVARDLCIPEVSRNILQAPEAQFSRTHHSIPLLTKVSEFRFTNKI
jgi:hypothetical protein